MKYMGSKRYMLQNGLGELISEQAKNSHRIVDLFCGASSIAWFSAENTRKSVLAVDLQAYAVVLAKSVIERTMPLNAAGLMREWFSKIEILRTKSALWKDASRLEANMKIKNGPDVVREARSLCSESSSVGLIWNAYGGYYFSPVQAITIDYMLNLLPSREPKRSVCLATIICTASQCAASPGHTAQPFQPTQTAWPYLRESWGRDPLKNCRKILNSICARYAQTAGKALIADAVEVASKLTDKDLVIVDPPYSGVQYSRFYHVLETIARGKCGPIYGAGRYPPLTERPQSKFSKKTTSLVALEKLLTVLATSGATVIFTFPDAECTNGLSGDAVMNKAKEYYAVKKRIINGNFSTLGGNNNHRRSRQLSRELLLLMKPR